MAAKKVLVLNAGSSSLKFKLFDEAKSKLVASVSGLIERIGDTSNSQVTTECALQVSTFLVIPTRPVCQLLPGLPIPSFMHPP